MEFVDAMAGMLHANPALEGEGFRHDADCECADFACDLSHDGCRAGTRSAAHAGGDEDHVGTLEEFAKSISRFERRGPTPIGIRAAAEATRDLRSELDFDRRLVVTERLSVRIRGDELDATQTRLDHGVECVTAPPTDADDLDRGRLVRASLELQQLLSVFGTEFQ